MVDNGDWQVQSGKTREKSSLFGSLLVKYLRILSPPTLSWLGILIYLA